MRCAPAGMSECSVLREDPGDRRAGMVWHTQGGCINRNQIGAVVGVQPFGCEGLWGTGPKTGVPYFWYGFCAEQTITISTTAAGAFGAACDDRPLFLSAICPLWVDCVEKLCFQSTSEFLRPTEALTRPRYGGFLECLISLHTVSGLPPPDKSSV